MLSDAAPVPGGGEAGERRGPGEEEGARGRVVSDKLSYTHSGRLGGGVPPGRQRRATPRAESPGQGPSERSL